MEDALLIHRLQFAFTVMYHYLFPQLTMGLALLIVIMKGIAIKKKDERWNESARFWGKIFAANFAMGVVTGIPMEFQFGTNWARFSSYAGGVIGQTLAMEGMFAFFLESSFLGLFIFGEKRLGPKGHFIAALLVFLGSWISGFFIVTTDAWMQHPVAYAVGPDGSVHLNSFWGLVLNPWALLQYTHTMIGAVITGAFVVSAVGAYYVLSKTDEDHGMRFLRIGVISGLIASVLIAFPTGDLHVKMVYEKQPVTFAAMEGHFETKEGVELVLIGQPDMETLSIDNPLVIPKFLSFMTHYRWDSEITGLTSFPKEQWPTNVPLLYYGYHIMVGLGTLFIAVMAVSVFFLRKKKLASARWLLWILMLAFPFPYIANTAGWMTAELGRQPWLVYGLFRTVDGSSPTVSSGNGLFTLMGFLGMYFVIGVLFLLIVIRLISAGPSGKASH
jgi:cytochrome bd ubiquinol oxidase subunit I